jgi:hypothetical protein
MLVAHGEFEAYCSICLGMVRLVGWSTDCGRVFIPG